MPQTLEQADINEALHGIQSKEGRLGEIRMEDIVFNS